MYIFLAEEPLTTTAITPQSTETSSVATESTEITLSTTVSDTTIAAAISDTAATTLEGPLHDALMDLFFNTLTLKFFLTL